MGAQFIAAAMGGGISPNPVTEIGWFPIQAVKSTCETTFKFPNETTVFHWHRETFSLPAGAVHLAQSAGCKNQAFQLGNNVIALQFHLETTPTSAQAIVAHCNDELVDADYIQTEQEILGATKKQYLAINHLMNDVLEYLHAAKK